MQAHPAHPRISVAMSVYNGERFLAESIESVLNQTFGDFEFLILDDGSQDGSRQIIQNYAEADKRVRPIYRENRGLIISLNQLLAEAAAPVIARMDADDICMPERFTRQYAFLEANPDHGVVGCWTLDIGVDGKHYPVGGEDHPITHNDVLVAIEKGQPPLSHPSTMYRRDIVLSVGGYHAAFRHCEDYDLWLRLASVTRIANLPERLLHYRHYPDQVSSKHLTEQLTGAAVARAAHAERQAGRKDPTSDLAALPHLEEIDALFGKPGLGKALRSEIARGLLYSPIALGEGGFDLVLEHIRDGGDRTGMWRTVPRLMRFGKPLRAARLAAALAAAPQAR